jgi:hypothetical protein
MRKVKMSSKKEKFVILCGWIEKICHIVWDKEEKNRNKKFSFLLDICL